MDVIAEIEKLRKERGWTKYKLAEEAMLTYSTLSAMYIRNTPPKLDILEMICTAFGLTLAQFFAGGAAGEFLSEDEKELLHSYRRLTAEKKKAVNVLINK